MRVVRFFCLSENLHLDNEKHVPLLQKAAAENEQIMGTNLLSVAKAIWKKTIIRLMHGNC